jgi:hypothetical protein
VAVTKDDLLALLASSLSHSPERTEGGYLFCHTPHVGEFAYLGRVYDPAGAELVRTWFDGAARAAHPYRRFVTEVANGLRVANINLNGVIGIIDRSVGPNVGQPISLDYGNAFGRPARPDDSDMVIGGMVGWSAEGEFIMDRKGAVRLVHPLNGDDVADQWPSLEAMLGAQLGRLGELFDAEGRVLTTHTDLMHPNGRRWETSVEPGSARH